jgi:hypothetical protein
MESLSENVLKHFGYLSIKGEKIEEKIKELFEYEYRRRLTRYEHVNRVLTQKYGMSFHDFEKNELIKKQGYSYEVESDSNEWEMALDGISSMKRGLTELLGLQFDA